MTSPIWRKSSRSNTQGGDCVEIARMSGMIGIRDSKNPAAGHISISIESFSALLAKAKRSEPTS